MLGHYGRLQAAQPPRKEPLLECFSLKTILSAFSKSVDTSSESIDKSLPSLISDNDPIAIGRAVALYLSSLSSQDELDLGKTILVRIYSFGLSQCHRAISSFPDPNEEKPLTYKDFVDRICPNPPWNDEVSKECIMRLIKRGSTWRTTLQKFEEITNGEVAGFLCLARYEHLWRKRLKKDRVQALRQLGRDPTTKRNISCLAAVVTFFWPWSLPEAASRMMVRQYKIPLAPHLYDWKAKSLAALGSSKEWNDGAILTMLMAFAPPDTPPDLEIFRKGASVRRRWDRGGEIVEREAADSFVDREIGNFLLDDVRFSNALQWYRSAGFCSSPTADSLRHHLPADVRLFWSYTAMVLTCGAVPWKSLTLVSVDCSALTRCLRHTVNEFAGVATQIPDDARLEIACSLVEASRLPHPERRLEWREFAIDKAEEMAHGLNMDYQRLHIAQTRSQLKRLKQDHVAARRVLDIQTQESDAEPKGPTAACNAARGQIAIQRSLNYLQADETEEAIKSLEAWVPGSTPMEAAVAFQARLLHAKTLRLEGKFVGAQSQLSELLRLQDKAPNLDLEEYRRDWAYETAAVLIEQNSVEQAEQHILDELRRMELKCVKYPKDVPLRLLLAESLFGQEKSDAAEDTCRALEEHCRLKFDRLHRHIILAKIHHAKFLAATSTHSLVSEEYRSSRDTAWRHWLEAIKLITGMTQNEGHSSLVLHTSVVHLLSYFDDAANGQVSEQIKSTIERAQLGKSDRSVKYWVPGLRNWKEKLAQPWPPIDGRSKL